MTRSLAVLLLVAACAAAEAPSPNPAGPATETVRDGDRLLVEYRHGGDLFKPYVAKFFSPGGVNVLRDQIADHVHHHGLMFAVGIDGVDFWAETKTSGRQASVSFARVKDNPDCFAWVTGIESDLAWVGPAGGQALVREDRKIAAYRMEALGATLITWQTKLQPAEGRASIKLAGSHYFGLGMRFVQSMDGADDFFTPEGKAVGETVRGNERLVRGSWCAYAAEAEGKPVTVAMFDHPGNVRPAWWFIMAKPFAYMSATLNLHREPLTVEAGKPLALTYGVAVWDGKVSADEIAKLHRRWLEAAQSK
jgi:hypothetical protein